MKQLAATDFEGFINASKTEISSPPAVNLVLTERRIAATLITWAFAVGVLSWSGALTLIPLPIFGALVSMGVVIPVTLYFRSPNLRAYFVNLGIKPLTAIHIWRISAAYAFFKYGTEGLLPETFVQNAAWGDLGAGALAAFVFVLPSGRMKWKVFHVIGMLDFIIAVGTGLTFSILKIPRMENIATFPLAFIPLFGVGLSGATHIISLHILNLEPKENL